VNRPAAYKTARLSSKPPVIPHAKSHEADCLYRFTKAYVVSHDPSVPESRVFKVMGDKKRPLT
jgi:hypothetical protein